MTSILRSWPTSSGWLGVCNDGRLRRFDLTRHTAEVPLIDQHVHGCWLTEGNRRRFENALNEANTEPLADFDSGFDSQLGFAVRNHCAPILGLPRHVDPQTYWDRRSQFSEAELARRFLQAAGVTDWLVETGIGYDVSGMASVAGLGELSGSHAHEVVRLEQVAEQAVQASGDYASAFNEILRRRAATAVATKSILAYRGGFDGDLTEPPAAQVAGPPSAGATVAVSDYRIGFCCASGCIRRCAWASRCSSTSDLATGTLICTRPIRCICSTSCGSPAIPQSCCCTAIPTNEKPVIWHKPSTTSILTAG